MTTNAATPLPQTGLLVVFADLGDQVTEHEFHDWYDNEHIPLRTATLKEFETAARFKLVQDGEVLHAGKATAATPTWGAIYTINDNDIFGKEGYTKLRANRSAREGDLVKRLGLLDRRIYKLVSLPSSNPTSSDPHPALVLVNNLTPSPSSSPDEFLALLESAEERYKNVPGFIRTRRYETVDVVRSGQLVNSGVEDAKKDVGKYFEITEFSDPKALKSHQFQALSEWYTEALEPFVQSDNGGYREQRAYILFREYEPTAAIKAAGKA